MLVDSLYSDEVLSDDEGVTDVDVILAKHDSSDEGSLAVSGGEEGDTCGSDTDSDISNMALLSFCSERRTMIVVKPI